MKPILRWLLPITALAIFVIPGWVFFDQRGGFGFLTNQSDFQAVALAAFPLIGLYAFTLLWFQLMLGSLMPWMRKTYTGIERWHRWEGVFVFLFSLTHPSLLLVGVGLGSFWNKTFIGASLAPYVFFGQTALLILTLTVLTALLRKTRWVQNWWRKIHFLNYVVFALVWWHSWNIGSDVQTTGLKWLWVAFGVTYLITIVLRLFGLTWKRSLRPKVSKGFVSIGSLEQIQEGKPFCAEVNGQKVAVFRFGEKVYAINDRCNHADGSLCNGLLEGNVVECPLHFSRFDVTTGALIDGPATQPQSTYRVRVTNGQVEVAV